MLVLLYNISFFRNVTNVYPASAVNIPFLVSIVIMLGSFIALLLSLCFLTPYHQAGLDRGVYNRLTRKLFHGQL
jgi:hypothetical protein